MPLQQYCIRTLGEAEQVAERIAAIFGNPQEVKLGLTELLVNAIEHGNLGIGYEEKGELLVKGIWKEEINRRLNLPQNRQKAVLVSCREEGAETIITVQDEGKGFDWTPYMAFDVSRNVDSHGRGIALARLFCFSKLEYKGPGNRVECHIRNGGKFSMAPPLVNERRYA